MTYFISSIKTASRVDNSIKISDLGMSGATASSVLERTVTTCWYRAPEVLLALPPDEFAGSTAVALGSKQQSVDLWSMGVVTAAMFCAKHLFAIKEGDKPVKLLQAQIDFLGPPVDLPGAGSGPAAWPGAASLPLWDQYLKDGLCLLSPTSSPRSKLAEGAFVPRPCSLDGHVAELILQLLVWDPFQRLSASAAGQHAALVDGDDTGPGMVLSPCERGGEALGGRVASSSAAPTRSGSGPSSGTSSMASSEISVDRSARSSPPLPEGACACAALCGRPECVRAKSNYYRTPAATRGAAVFCKRAATPSFRHCVCCKCSYFGCMNSVVIYHDPSGMWCRTHALSPPTLPHYSNAEGLWEVAPDWDWALQAVAVHGHWLDTWTCCDLDWFLRAGRALLASSDTLDGHMVLNLWSAAWAKWPLFIQHWMARQGWPLGGDGGAVQPYTGWPSSICAGAPARTAIDFAALSDSVAKDDGLATPSVWFVCKLLLVESPVVRR